MFFLVAVAVVIDWSGVTCLAVEIRICNVI